MPVEVESTGQVGEFLRLLRSRAAWILIPFAIISSLGTAIAVIIPKKFVSTTRIMVHDVPGAGSSTSEGREQGKVAKHLILSPRRVQSVIVQDLGWPFQQLTDAEQEALIVKVMGNLSVETPNMGLGVLQQIVSISYADTNRSRAYEFLSAVSERWRNEVLEASRNAKTAEYENLTNRMRQMETREKVIGDEIAEIHRNNDIPPWNPDSRGERPVDASFQRLDELRLSRAELDATIEEAELKLEEDEKLYELMDDEVPLKETEVGIDLTEEILAHEEKIVELRAEIQRQRYKSEHTKYKQIMDEIREREDVIRLLAESATSGSVTETKRLPNVDKLTAAQQLEKDRIGLERHYKHHEDLGRELANVEARTKELQSVYQHLQTLMGERSRLHANLIEIGGAHNNMRREIDILKSSAGNPFTVLDEPKMPVRPTQPDPVLIIVFSIFASLALGFGLAIALEFSKSCFRSVNDVTRVMVVPVLGTVNKIVTRKDRRRTLVGRVTLGGSTFLFVVAIGFITWAWDSRPDLLTDDLRESIDSFRSSFE
ncbi:MAG: hypothetical protein O2816_15585 [Planctomycetota bacterium]|nr:hypothetical protein [Planctomycetota bacterium]